MPKKKNGRCDRMKKGAGQPVIWVLKLTCDLKINGFPFEKVPFWGHVNFRGVGGSFILMTTLSSNCSQVI